MPAFVAELPPAFPFPLFFCLPHKCRAVLRFWTLLTCALHIHTLIRTHSFEYLLCAWYSHAYSSGLALLFRPHNWISTSCPFLRQLKAASNPGLYDHSCKMPNQGLCLRSSSFFMFSLASHGQLAALGLLFSLHCLGMVCLSHQSQEQGASLSVYNPFT